MVVGEGQRRALHQRLAEVLGVDEADALMEHLSPSSWGDVARRSDLDHLERMLRMEISSAEVRLRAEMTQLSGDLKGEMAKQTRSLNIAMAAMIASLVGSLAVASLQL